MGFYKSKDERVLLDLLRRQAEALERIADYLENNE